MTSVSFARIGLVASVAALIAFGARPALAAPPAACPGEVSVGPTGDMIPAPAGMPLNCTVSFYDGTVNFAGGVTGYATDGSITTTYDQQGRVVGVTNSLGETIILPPETGELSTITDPLGHTTTFTYNTSGSVIDVAGPMSSTTSYTYDSSQRLMTVTDPLGVTTTNAYDAEGRLMSSTPSVGNATTTMYDGSGRLTEETVGGVTTMYTYNTSGQLVEMSDTNDTKYTYDGMGRLMTETITPPSGGLTTTIMYDPDGDVASVTEPDGTKTTYTYDSSNHLIEATETPMGGGATDTTTYSYDMGELVSVTYPEDKITTFAYNAYGDVISMTDPGGGVTTFSYFVVPEPPTWAAMLLGFAGLVFVGRRRAKQGALLSA